MTETILKLTGHVEAYVRRAANPEVNELVFSESNTIVNALKENFRDTMNSSVDFALDNLRAVQAAVGTAGDDGILLYGTDVLGSLIGIMANAVHPTDPSGNYYRQWQGVWQEPSGSTVKSALIGQNFLSSIMLQGYASEDISPDIVLITNDILTINWKISLG